MFDTVVDRDTGAHDAVEALAPLLDILAAGRSTRTVTPAQRRALAVRDGRLRQLPRSDLLVRSPSCRALDRSRPNRYGTVDDGRRC
jgi:hypothetical protein